MQKAGIKYSHACPDLLFRSILLCKKLTLDVLEGPLGWAVEAGREKCRCREYRRSEP
jgi:hypothetical protein